MYTLLLSIHSIVRWLILLVFVYAIIRAFYGWLLAKEFTKTDKRILLITASLAHLQLVVGVWLYFVSPIVNFFIHNFHEAVKLKEFRFFGMEHSLLMLIAITLITIGSSVAKRKKTDKAKFRTIAVWYTLGLILILSAIPY
jgi:4-amino-4-deoxy-L-arabinose transferase-like glycosyltransferase